MTAADVYAFAAVLIVAAAFTGVLCLIQHAIDVAAGRQWDGLNVGPAGRGFDDWAGIYLDDDRRDDAA